MSFENWPPVSGNTFREKRLKWKSVTHVTGWKKRARISRAREKKMDIWDFHKI